MQQPSPHVNHDKGLFIMPIIRRHPSRFTIVPNEAIEAGLSFEALGVLTYLLSKPDDWTIHTSEIRKRGGIGKDKMQRIMRELREAGLLHLQTVRDDETGRMKGQAYVLYDAPHSQENRERENTAAGKSGPILNTDYQPNTDSLQQNTLSSADAEDRSPRREMLPVSEAFEAWDAIAGGAGLPKIRSVTPQRRQKMRARLNEMKAIKKLDPLAIWQAALRQLVRSPHHMGENERGWRANIDFMLQAGRWQQFFEPIADAILKQAQQQAQTVPADTEEVRRARKLAEELKREMGLR